MSYPYLGNLVSSLTGYDVIIPVPMFGILVATAMLISMQFLKLELRRLYNSQQIGMARISVKLRNETITENLVPPDEIIYDFVFVVLLAGILGARLFHIFEHTDEFLVDPWNMIFTRSGFSILGGLVIGTIAGVIFVKKWHLPIRPMLDATAPTMMLGYAIGRIGCQISGDGDWGIVANMNFKPDWLPAWFWAQTYQHNIVGIVIPLPGVYPAPIYETMMCLICFAILWAVRKHSHQPGWLFALYLLLTGAERFLIEHIRINPVFNFFGYYATQAEAISVLFIFSGLLGILMLRGHSSIAHSNMIEIEKY